MLTTCGSTYGWTLRLSICPFGSEVDSGSSKLASGINWDSLKSDLDQIYHSMNEPLMCGKNFLWPKKLLSE